VGGVEYNKTPYIAVFILIDKLSLNEVIVQAWHDMQQS
jgi:hypothetical protein